MRGSRMTQERDFKKIIRTRMRKTGESYAAARASLLSWRATKCGQSACSWNCNKRCIRCGEFYCPLPIEWLDSEYYRHPTDYSRGSVDHCLACWLGVGPKDIEEWDR